MKRAWSMSESGVFSWWKRFPLVVFTLLISSLSAAEAYMLDDFSNPLQWKVVTSNQVSGSLHQVDGPSGKALCLDYDFNGVSGYVGIQRDLPIDYPENYQFRFQLRGDSPGNDLQFKLIDDGGDNVWWVNRTHYAFPVQWSEVRYKKRHIDKAWGPDPDRVLRHSRKVEFTIYNQVGGSGSVCFGDLVFEALPPEDRSPLTVTATSLSPPPVDHPESSPALAVDGDPDTAWHSVFGDRENDRLVLDLGKIREFGGLTLAWDTTQPVDIYSIELSADGQQWQEVYETLHGGGLDLIPLPESAARYIRISPIGGFPGSGYALKEAVVEPLEFAATANDFVRSVARYVPRGWVPRAFRDEQTYWTIVGIDGGDAQGLLGEDGALEVAKGGFSIEPFVDIGDRWITWAEVQSTQSLQDGYLPVPSVEWMHPQFGLRVTAFAQGESEQSQLYARYRLSNPGPTKRTLRLGLAIRPFQVNPPSQFLNTIGGVSRIDQIEIKDKAAWVNFQPRVYCLQPPQATAILAFDPLPGENRDIPFTVWPGGKLGMDTALQGRYGLLSGMMIHAIELEPGQSREIDLLIPLRGGMPFPGGEWEPDALQQQVAEQWRRRLDQVRINVPAAGRPLVDTLRTATAHMLISRIGPRLQPGTRSYSRSWIRDGAMISEGLLRMGCSEVVADYLRWYAPYQFKDGMVPCCVDARGSDPVPENDSHGELIFTIAEHYRYTGDRELLAAMWPHVQGAFDYMEKLRLSERTEANRALNPAFYGLMPVSISHEGYSAKPMHSYWDDFWTLRGYKDAVDIARWLGKESDAERFARARDQFGEDLHRSLRLAAQAHAIDYLPGAAELGDFDPTSTTIALAPGGEQARLPQDLLHGTFERYWGQFVQRRDGLREWKDYTPYEWRNVSAFVRLGWRQRAWEASGYFFKDRAPQAWNQWAEVVTPTPRKPFFLGDLPHAWVASDFVRSALDMFAYHRESDQSLVLAAGIPPEWLDGDGVAVEGLRTAHGKLSYSLRRENGRVHLHIDAGIALPNGGVVLPWPYPEMPSGRLERGEAEWNGRELRLTRVPAEVVVSP